MFSGIIRSSAQIVSLSKEDGDGTGMTLVLDESPSGLPLLRDVVIGESIAVNGVCLTVVRFDETRLRAEFDIATETSRRTTLGSFEAGRRVNLERSLCLGDPVDGHLVQGHVDGTVALISRVEEGANTTKMRFSLPADASWGIAQKGSVAIDGVSLTVGEVSDEDFTVYVIPQTLVVTTLGMLRESQRANIEIDCLARYVRRIVSLPTKESVR